MALVLRQVKGSPLTVLEADGNFTFLYGLIQGLMDAHPRAIESIDQLGNSVIINYTDYTQDGPFQLGDLQLRGMGEWAPLTGYIKYDIITHSPSAACYLVGVTHTSGSEFDAAANDGLGHLLYQLLVAIPGNALPTGGVTHSVLAKLSNTNYNVGWRERGVPPDGVVGDTLLKLSSDEGDYAWRSRGSLIAPPTVTVPDATIVPTSDDANTYMRCTNDDGCHVTITKAATAGWVLDTEMRFRQCGAGPVVLVEADGVTLNPVVGFETITATEGAVILAKYVGSDAWDVWGFLGTST